MLHDELGEPDGIYRNLGNGRFAAVPFTNGFFFDEAGVPLAEPPFDWGLSVMFRDLNGDGAPDIYVCNDFGSPDRIWMNDGAGRFRALAKSAIRQISLSTMAVDVADLNRDGFDEIFTADMLSPDRWRRLVQINQVNPNMQLFEDVKMRPQSPRNMLQLNRGDGTYAEIAQMAGVEASGWSWASCFLDVDLDGYEDLLVANGFERDFLNMDAHRRVRAAQAQVPRGQPPAVKLAANRLYPRLVTANLAFRNLGNLKFVESGKEWGFDVAAVSQGMCLADLDNDGDFDVAINNLNGPATLLRNDTTAPRLAIRLKGNAPNTRGIGARLKVLDGSVAQQSQEMISGGRYLSSDDAMRVFAAGGLTNRLTVEVRWRNGARSLFTNLAPNHVYEIAEAGSKMQEVPQETNAFASAPLFKDVSDLLDHLHQQISEDDAAVQPMLPIRLESLGPGLAWLDIDGDGREDLIPPSGKVGTMSVYHNDTNGRFVRQSSPALGGVLEESQTAVVGWRAAEGGAVLLSGFNSGSAPTSTNSRPVRQYHLDATGDRIAAPFPATTNSTGPVALADIDGDGDLDLFVGGRFVPGRWPEPASSALFRQDKGQWVQEAAHSNLFHKVGLISGAVFTDIDADGDPDLALACEWGPIRIFANDKGHFTASDWKLTFGNGTSARNEFATLSALTGWWNGVNAGDFDGDGRLDLVASNWGRNTKYERFRSRPLRVYFGDFAGDHSVSILETWFDPGLGKHTPIHDVWTLSRSLPWLLARYNSYEAFARASIEEALGDRFRDAHYWEAGWLDTTVFLNRGDHFEVRVLPAAAQVAPAFATCVADFNGDGHEDLFLSQNFFAVRQGTSRSDAGRGLLLLGDGRGDFTPMTAQESGLAIDGEQRGAAVCDYDNDGRVDLAVTQVGDRTRLYHNATARPGLRVRLKGSPGNPQAIGAVLRLKSEKTWGPARELHAGSGYWSQDSAVPVLSHSERPLELWLRWPGGKITTAKVQLDLLEISLESPELK
jgi:enediyne biosynthesis protein E4